MKIRLAKKGDFNEVMRLLTQLWSPGKIVPKNMKKLKKAWHKNLKSNYTYNLIMEDKGRLIAHVTMRVIPEFWLKAEIGFIDDVIVDEPYRGQGLGQKLMEAMEKLAKKKKVKTMGLYTEDYRPQAIKLYESHGYERFNKIFFKKEL